MKAAAALAAAVLVAVVLLVPQQAAAAKPNVDDVGAADVGFSYRQHHPQDEHERQPIRTPHIDRLAQDAVRLSHYYVHPVCTPSRAALLTGRYSSSAALPGVIIGTNTHGLNDSHATIAQAFRSDGYATHMVGKWHLGFSKPKYTPLHKGFDTFLGLYNGAFSYYSKRAGPLEDLTNGTTPFWTDRHATPLFADEAIRLIQADHAANKPFFLYLAFNAAHSPLESEPQHLPPCQHIKFGPRRDYCGLLTGLDEAVGNVTRVLAELGQLDNTIIVFSTDNGGMPSVGGLNYPLRGTKNSMFEGGMRAVGFIRHPASIGANKVYDGLIHISDWFPTLAGLAGLPATKGIEGVDQSAALKANGPSPRKEILLNLDDTFTHTNKTAYRDERYKIIVGFAGDSGLYLEPIDDQLNGRRTNIDFFATGFYHVVESVLGKGAAMIFEVMINHARVDVSVWLGIGGAKWSDVLLYDLVEDPYENNNLAAERPDLVAKYLAIIEEKRQHRPHTRDWQLIYAGSEPKPFVTDPRYPNKFFWHSFLADDVDIDTLPYENVFFDYYARRINAVLAVLVLGSAAVVYGIYALVLKKKSQEAKPKKE